ncbi:thermonuclease family protein [Patescibacteria group bacterium]|nr:thermonuclease family protein [Patescibacteria group bacterium]
MIETRVRRALYFFGFILAMAGFLSFTQTPEQAIEATPSPVVQATSTRGVVTTTVSDVVSIKWSEMVSSTAQITRVIDGDTIDALIDGETKIVRVRLIGVNTPESVDPRKPVQCFGKEASKHVKTWIEGKRVALVEDPQGDDRDKYGRLLRILVLEDGTDVNATLVANGYAHAYVDFPMKKTRKAQMRTLEREAQSGQRGLWNSVTCNGEAYPTNTP